MRHRESDLGNTSRHKESYQSDSTHRAICRTAVTMRATEHVPVLGDQSTRTNTSVDFCSLSLCRACVKQVDLPVPVRQIALFACRSVIVVILVALLVPTGVTSSTATQRTGARGATNVTQHVQRERPKQRWARAQSEVQNRAQSKHCRTATRTSRATTNRATKDVRILTNAFV